MSSDERALRDHLLELLHGDSAHVDLATVVDDFPEKLRGAKPEKTPYSAWQLLEHMRIAANDLLIFSTDPNYVAPKWPDDYWPAKEAPQPGEWENSVKALKADLAAFADLVRDPRANLYAKIPWGDGQTLLREILVACDHTSYHLGEMVLIRRQLGAWRK